MDIYRLFYSAGEIHGHLCPGLAIGVRAAAEAMAEMGSDGISCHASKKACWADGLRSVLGLSTENGTLSFGADEDAVFTFSGSGIVMKLRLLPLPDADKQEKIDFILTSPIEQVFEKTKHKGQ